MGKKKIGLVMALFSTLLVLSISIVAAGKSEQGNDNLKKTTLQVSNLSCGSCLATIEGELRKSTGMVDMSADLRRGLVTVAHTPDFSKEKIAWIITESGYPARVLTDVEYTKVVSGQASGTTQASGCGSRGCGTGGCGTAPPANLQNGPKS